MNNLKINVFLCISFFSLSLKSEITDDRSIRPNVQGIKESDAIVGPSNSSLDQAFIAQKLGLIKKCLCSLSIDITGVFTVIEGLGLCDPIPLTQADVIGGTILLDIPGFNYCMAENIIGDIEITGDNINLDMNDRVLFGTILIDANEVVVENGKINPPAPLSPLDLFGAVTIGSENIVLRDLLIICEDTIVPDVDGRIGIENDGNKTKIIDCSIKSGSAFGSTGGPANGGIGIFNFGNDLLVTNCSIETGRGGSEIGVGGVGNGGNGIQSSQDGLAIIKNCLIKTGTGGTGLTNNSGGTGGNGIEAPSGSFNITDCVILTGDGGPGTVGWERSGFGMRFINNAQDVFIEGCSIETGNGGGILDNTSSGVRYEGAASFKIQQSCIITGSGLDVPSGNRGDGGDGVISTSPILNELTNLTIQTGDGGNSNGGFGGDGIQVSNGQIIIKHCNVVTGNGGNATVVSGGNSGQGIITFADEQTHIQKCIVTIGNPGSGPGGVGTNSNGIQVIPIGFNVNTANISDSIVTGALSGFVSQDMDTLSITNCKAENGTGSGFFINNTGLSVISNCESLANNDQGFFITTATTVDPSSCKIIDSEACNNGESGFLIIGNIIGFTITNCQSVGNGGDGFLLAIDVLDGHLISNQANNNGNIGINNASGNVALHQIYNNVSSQNAVANYFGVAPIENAPTVATGFYANVI